MDTFCDKNKDELPKESDELFASSPNPFVVHLFNPDKGERCIIFTERYCGVFLHSYQQ